MKLLPNLVFAFALLISVIARNFSKMVIETRQDDCRGGQKKQKTLLQKLDVPVEHLDFRFVETCKDPKEIEKVLRILRSGEEGYYPEFEDFVKKRLEELNPQSRYLRVETPAIRTSELGSPEKSEIEQDILSWLGQCESGQSNLDQPGKLIFSGSGDCDNQKAECPIRGTCTTNVEVKPKEVPKTEDNFLKPKNPNRIKSWDYDKWDKFNVDAELTKLEIEELKAAEQQKQGQENPKPNNKSSKTETNAKKASEIKRKPESPRPSTSKAAIARAEEENRKFRANNEKKSSKSHEHGGIVIGSTHGSLGPSFIEEISADESENLVMNSRKTKQEQISSSTPALAQMIQEISEPKEDRGTKKESINEQGQGRRFKIIIEDLKIG